MTATPAPTSPCEKCGRPVALTAKRCIYCGTFRYKSLPGTPERAAEEAVAREDEKKLKQQAAMYRAGMGLPKDAKGPPAGKPLDVVWLLPMLMVRPIWAFKKIAAIFRP